MKKEKRKEKILIIKTGYTEILDQQKDTRVVSYGDVLRTTPLLHKYKDKDVTWVSSEQPVPLLKGNHYINKILTLDTITGFQLMSEEFDKIINLEKVPGICALSDRIHSRRARYGFTFNTQTGEAEPLDKAYEVLAVGFDIKHKKTNKRTFQELLFEMVGEEFKGEECVLGYKPKTKETYDLGFNTKAGSKWPSKSWAMKNWDNLEKILKNKFSISRQDKQPPEVLTNLYDYIDWINSCKTLVTNDSLGLHIALTLKKDVLALFGPTFANELYFYNRGKPIFPDNAPECMPCFEAECLRENNYCMNLITPEKVAKEIQDYHSTT